MLRVSWARSLVTHARVSKYIIQQPFPLDMNMLKALARSPLGIDLYVWLAYRMYNLQEPAAITWEQLHIQMGGTYGSTDNFARDARRELKKIKLAWSGLQYDTPRGRLVLQPSSPSVQPTKPRRQIKA